MRAKTSAGKPCFLSTLAIALAIMAGLKSALARSNVLALGLDMDHSPPWPSSLVNLPQILGLTSERQL